MCESMSGKPSRLNFEARCAAPIAIPTPLAKPCPSGPVVISTPGVRHVLGVAGGLRPPLAEVLQLFERQVVARQVQQRVEQHRAVAGGEQEAVAPLPLRVARVVAQEARPDDVGHRRGAERQARVARLGALDGVDGKRADRVDAELVEFGRGVSGRRGRAHLSIPSIRFLITEISPTRFIAPAPRAQGGKAKGVKAERAKGKARRLEKGDGSSIVYILSFSPFPPFAYRLCLT